METIGVIGFGVSLWIALAPPTVARDTPRRRVPPWLGWLLAAECLLLLILTEAPPPLPPELGGNSTQDTTGQAITGQDDDQHTARGWFRPIPTQLGEPAELPLLAPGIPVGRIG